MPEIRGHFPRVEDPSREVACVFCGDPTSTLAEAPGLEPPTELPLHVLCAAEIVYAFRTFRAGGTLRAGTAARLLRYQLAIAVKRNELPSGEA